MASRKNIEAKVAGSPSRVPPRAYNDAVVGYSVDEVAGNRVFHPNEEFSDDDDQRVTEKLVKSGVDEPYDDQDHPNEKDEDREFALGQQAYSSHARHEHVSEEQGLDADDDIAEDEQEEERLAGSDDDEEEEEDSQDDEDLEDSEDDVADIDSDDEDLLMGDDNLDAEARQGTFKAERSLV